MADKKAFKERLKYFKPMLLNLFEPFKIIFKDPLGRIGAVILSIIILTAIFAPLLATHDPNQMNERIEGSLIPFDEDGEWKDYQVVGEYPFNEVAIGEDYEIAAADGGYIYLKEIGESWQEFKMELDIDFLAAAVYQEMKFVAGEDGIILREVDGSWQRMPTDTDQDINDLVIIGSDQAYAVGDNGLFLRWDGVEWSQIDSGTTRNLREISFSAPEDAIIVGDRGSIIHYRDGELSEPSYRGFMDSTFRNLLAVSYFSPNQAIAVGERATVMIYDGENWYADDSGASRSLNGVIHISESEAYAIGLRGTILKYDGETWETLDRITRRDYRGISYGSEKGYIYGVEPYVNELATPSRDHFFGTTHLGRDIWSQVMYGTRTALMVGIIAALVVNFIGATVGLIAGYYRGGVDNFLMRIVDIMYGLPLEPFAIILVLIFEPSLWIIIMAIGLLTWRTNARIIRSQVLSLVERPFIKAARVAGASDARIMLIHITPNILPLAFLQLAVAMGYAITAEATLSFLGLGPPQIYSWGTILHSARLSGAWRTAWWWVIPPGLFICVTVVSVFLISRSLEVLTNPRLRGGRDNAPEPEESEDILPNGQ
ncbi:ABC transporter permease [Halanaerobium hydrogeniformans]|uniref:Binding-protein-dependent transport systems inner membrane component n=1 Tax=Halanaerobium hydrogeniformans TaxID=656519 RepID=E4RPS4_HALHG|nr:ABC transporter permease [Halanaerobium hydrogeniformans]ADQ13958.1 binding-protein-dependent transport systems inner membrane component [Halanaerobium hydrogeniformans]